MKNTQPAIPVENLRILVVDDNETHRKSAQAQLGKTNTVSVVGTYDEAQKLLAGTYVSGNGREGMETFDMVLVDLLMPASGRAQGDKGQQYVGEEMPVGIFLALLAAKQGAKHVAVFTDSDHHSHQRQPASISLMNTELAGVLVKASPNSSRLRVPRLFSRTIEIGCKLP